MAIRRTPRERMVAYLRGAASEGIKIGADEEAVVLLNMAKSMAAQVDSDSLESEYP